MLSTHHNRHARKYRLRALLVVGCCCSLLTAALTAAPTSARAAEQTDAPARQPHQVRVDDEWLSIDDACQRLAASDRVQAYLAQRDTAALTIDDQYRLARWCDSNGLNDSARAHYQLVLQFDRTHRGARNSLGVREFRGQLLSLDAVESARRDQRQQQQAIKQWRSTLTALDRRLNSRNPAVREAARYELLRISDPSVVPAVEHILCRSSSEAATAGIELLASFDTVPAFDALVRQACLSPHDRVRQYIAEQLKQHSPFRWVPQLLAAMQSPVSLRGQINYDQFNSTFAMSLYREGPFADELFSSMTISSRRWDAESLPNVIRRRDNAQVAADLQAAVEQHNQQAAVLNQRVGDTLALATGESLPADQESWYRWWYDQNEYYYPQDRPIVSHTERTATTYSKICSCFLAGTLVTTWTGLRPIESIQVGDCVLAIDIETGDLQFQPVLGTTLRPPSPMLKITAGDATLHITRGHPLWVVGRGWQMAKEIRSGDQLYATPHNVTVSEISEWAGAEAHNLIVADSHNYLVTSNRLLVHDNTLRRPTDLSMPGVAASEHSVTHSAEHRNER